MTTGTIKNQITINNAYLVLAAVTALNMSSNYISLNQYTMNPETPVYAPLVEHPWKTDLVINENRLVTAEMSDDVEKVKVIKSFASQLISESKDLDPIFSEGIYENIWDLI